MRRLGGDLAAAIVHYKNTKHANGRYQDDMLVLWLLDTAIHRILLPIEWTSKVLGWHLNYYWLSR